MVTDAQSTICGLRASTTRVPEPAASSADQMAYATGGTALVAQGTWVQRGNKLDFVPYPAVASVVIKAFANEAAGIPGGWLRSRILDRRRGNAYYRRLTPRRGRYRGNWGSSCLGRRAGWRTLVRVESGSIRIVVASIRSPGLARHAIGVRVPALIGPP